MGIQKRALRAGSKRKKVHPTDTLIYDTIMCDIRVLDRVNNRQELIQPSLTFVIDVHARKMKDGFIDHPPQAKT
jgi:hypothetical protein